MSDETRPKNQSADLINKSSEMSPGPPGQQNDEASALLPEKLIEDRHPIDILADEISARLRAGESPSIEEYELREPAHRALIRSFFPTIAIIERMTVRSPSVKKPRQRMTLDRKQIGDFQIIREIGRGGMGIVYEAIQTSLARRVALKVLGSGIANSPQQLQRFRREAESAARLHHTNIVPVYGIGEEDGIHFYAMQYIDGIPLADAIATVKHRSSATHPIVDHDTSHAASRSSHFDKSSVGSASSHRPSSAINDATILMAIDSDSSEQKESAAPGDSNSSLGADYETDHGSDHGAIEHPNVLPLIHSNGDSPAADRHGPTNSNAETVDLCFGSFTNNTTADYFLRISNLTAQVADALEYAHQHGVLHRDIKPSNLMIDRTGSVWIMDFGLVKIIEQQNLTLAGEIVGTLRYMAPEQLEGRADVRTDIYALGLTLFELLTLKPAFDGDETVTLAQRLSQSEIPRPRSMNPAIPQDLETIVLKATAREPFARYATAAMFADDLRRFCDDRPILARRATYVERLWRWSRRNPALASATMSSIFLVWLVAVVASVGWLRVNMALKKADEAQAQTEANLMSAIEAFDGILENVTSRGLPRSLAEDVLSDDFEPMQSTSSEDDARLLDRLLEFYRKFAYANADNTSLRERTANAHRNAGTILVRLGRLDEASEDFETAIKLLSANLKTDPLNVAAVVKVASIRNELGELYLRRGEFDQVLKSHLEARAILLSLPAKARKDPSVRFEFARATDLFASIDIRSGTDQSPFRGPPDGPNGHHPPFEKDHEKNRDQISDPVDKNGKRSSDASLDFRGPPLGTHRPDGPPLGGPPPSGRSPRHGPRPEGGPSGPFFDGLSESVKNALPAAFSGDPKQNDGLEQTLLEACDEFRALVEKHPDHSEYRFRFAQCLRHRLVHAAGKKDLQIVQETYREAKEFLEHLREKFPEDPKYLFELAETLTQASRAEEDDLAIDSLDLAVSYAERLESHFPSVSEYQLLLGRALARRAAVEEKVRSVSDAKISLEKSIEALELLTKQFPDQGVFQIPLAKTRQQLGDMLRRSVNTIITGTEIPEQRLEKSLTVLQTAIDGFERYLALSEDVSSPQKKGHFNLQTRTSLYSSLAETLAELQRPDAAEKARQIGLRPPGAKLDSLSQPGF